MRISDWSSDLCSSDLKPRADSVVAIEPASVAVLQRRFVMAFVDRNPDVALRIIGVLCEKLRRTNARITDGTGCATSARLARALMRSEEHTSELQSLMRISYAVFCLKKKKNHNNTTDVTQNTCTQETA